MILALTFVAVIAIIGFFIWLNRDNWFQSRQRSSRTSYVPTAQPTTPPQPQQQTAQASQQSANTQPKKSVWNSFKPVLGWVLGIGLVIWIGFSAYQRFSTFTATPVATAGISPTLGNRIGDVDYTISVLGGCETGTGTPGSGRQFLADGKTPVRNPQDAPAGTGAVGETQLNLSDPAVVADLKTLEAEMKADGRLGKDESLDVEHNRAHNLAGAKFLLQKYGTAPWTASVGCWADKITMPGGLVATIEASVGKLGGSFPIPIGFKFDVSGGGKKYKIELVGFVEENGIRKPFTITRDIGVAGSNEKIPGKVETIRVQSLEEESVIVKITLTPKT